MEGHRPRPNAQHAVCKRPPSAAAGQQYAWQTGQAWPQAQALTGSTRQNGCPRGWAAPQLRLARRAAPANVRGGALQGESVQAGITPQAVTRAGTCRQHFAAIQQMCTWADFEIWGKHNQMQATGGRRTVGSSRLPLRSRLLPRMVGSLSCNTQGGLVSRQVTAGSTQGARGQG